MTSKSVRSNLLLFFTAVILGGLGGMLGSMAGNLFGSMAGPFGKAGMFAGGVIGGLLAAILTGRIAAARGWVAPSKWGHVAIGTAVGFLAATGVAVNTLSSPVGPILSTMLIGIGALVGARFAARA